MKSIKRIICLALAVSTIALCFVGCVSNTGQSNKSTDNKANPSNTSSGSDFKYAIIYRLPSPLKAKYFEDSKNIEALQKFVNDEISTITPIESEDVKKGWSYHVRFQISPDKISVDDVAYMLQGNKFITGKKGEMYRTYEMDDEFITRIGSFYDSLDVKEVPSDQVPAFIKSQDISIPPDELER